MSTELAIATGSMFAPIEKFVPPLQRLFQEYNVAKNSLEKVATFMGDQHMRNALGYFMNGNKTKYDRYTPDPEDLFDLATGTAALDSSFWGQAMGLTDVYDFMPDKRRREWNEQITQMKTPPFNPPDVLATLEGLLNQRYTFLAETIDGLFNGLSSEHLTNSPKGFAQRMIINYVYDEWGYCHRKAGLIHDLRTIMARFLGREQPAHGTTHDMLRHFIKTTGRWFSVDGNAFNIRVYKKGTAHVEIHEDMAWRLNAVLAHLHPRAISDEARRKPTRASKEIKVTLVQEIIPNAVRSFFTSKVKQVGDYWTMPLTSGSEDRYFREHLDRVVNMLGGAVIDDAVVFEFDPADVIDDIVLNGSVPDHRSHQFYPTPVVLAMEAVNLAEIGPTHLCLEPSAGQGAIAEFMPRDRTTLVEISKLFCTLLNAKGYPRVAEPCDFLQFDVGRSFDRIVMNPPFSEGRAMAHVKHALTQLKPNGILVAILPASFKGKDDLLPGRENTWSEIRSNEFDGTSASVVILTSRPVAQKQTAEAITPPPFEGNQEPTRKPHERVQHTLSI